MTSKDLFHLLVDLNLSSLKIKIDRLTDVNVKFLLELDSVLPVFLPYLFTCLSVHLVSNLL